MVQEIWKSAKYIDRKGNIIDFQGWYEVSNKGRVRSWRAHGGGNYSGRRANTPTLLKTKKEKTSSGYISVNMKLEGINSKQWLVHRLVLSTFIPFPDSLKNEEWVDVNHIDENKHNNNLENLEWVTRRHNNLHGTRLKRSIENGSKTKQTKEWKEKHTGKYVTNSRPVIGVAVQGETIIEFECMNQAEIFIGVPLSARSVSACCRGKQKTAYGYYWYYKEDYEREYTKQGVTTNGDECNRVQ